MNLRGYHIKETFSLFPTCVMEFDLSDSINDINTLLEVIRSSNSSSHELLENGESSFYAGYNILDVDIVKPLKETIELCIRDYTATAGLEEVIIANSWWNKLGNKGVVSPHRHHCSVVSGAFYPYVEPNSSELYFNSPLIPYKMNDAYKSYTMFSVQQENMTVKQNHMYLFPSWLEHGVKTNNSNERIVVSFNADRK